MADKTDCFAYERGCRILSVDQCAANCHFYKKKGTECDTCPKHNTNNCINCRNKKPRYNFDI